MIEGDDVQTGLGERENGELILTEGNRMALRVLLLNRHVQSEGLIIAIIALYTLESHESTHDYFRVERIEEGGIAQREDASRRNDSIEDIPRLRNALPTQTLHSHQRQIALQMNVA